MALTWENIKCEIPGNGGFFSLPVSPMRRAKVPGGWFVSIGANETSAFFYPDPEHIWDGSSLP